MEILPDGRLNTVDAAAYLGLAVATLACMRSRKTGPRYIKRGRVFYHIADLDGWLKAGERLPAPLQLPAIEVDAAGGGDDGSV